MRITSLLRFILIFWIFLLVFSKSDAQPCGWIEKVEQLCLPGTNKARFKVYWNPPQPGYNGGFTVKNYETGVAITPTSPGIYDVIITHNTAFEIKTVGPVATCGPPQVMYKEILAPSAPDKVLCKANSYPNLNSFNPIPIGGTWSGSYVSADGTIAPGIAIGTYSFLYTYTYNSSGLNCTNSDIVNITISDFPPAPTVSQSTVYTCANKDFTATATNTDPSYTIKWYLQQTGGTSISSEQTLHYISPNPIPSTFWACAVNSYGCESISRTPATFTPYLGDPIAGSTANCAPVIGVVTVNTTGQIEGWEISITGGASWVTYDNAPKIATFNYNVLENTLIRAIVKKGDCIVRSQAATITVNKSIGGTPVASYTVNACRNIQGTISLGNSKTGEIQAWYVSKDKINWKIVTGINLNSPVPFQITDSSKYYFATVRLGTCAVDSSDIIAIHSRAYAGNIKVLSQINCHTATGNLELTDKYGEVNRWEYSETPDDPGSWIKIANSNNVIYNFNNVTKNTSFRAVVKLLTCLDSAYSPVASIQVSNPPVGILARSESPETCDSTANPIKFKGQFKLKEYLGTIVRWEKYDVTGRWDSIPNSAGKVSYDYQVTSTTRFRVRLAMNGCDDIYSGEATFYVNPAYKGKERKASAIIQKYDGHSYISNGSIILSKGFKFYANSCQDFSITVDENYTLYHSDENFILTETINKEGIKDIEEINWLDAMDKQSEYNYYDGLGRAKQKVVRKGSPNQLDVIYPIIYDKLGRLEYDLLPYVSSTKNGTFQENFEVAQKEFYTKDNDAIANSLHPFSRSVFDDSPLNRITEQGSPGTAWQPLPVEGGGRTVKKQYLTNIETDIKIWVIQDSLPVSTGNYKAGQLLVNVTLDERGFKVKEYLNKNGITILKRVESRIKLNEIIWADTYYIFNAFGSPAFILPPLAVSKLQGNPSDSFLRLWAFSYRYDNRQRVKAKRMPGADWIYLFYDLGNKLRLIQDGRQRKNNEYLVTKYDDLSRSILTGTWIDSLKRNPSQIQLLINQENQWYEVKSSSASSNGYTLNQSFPPVKSDKLLSVNYYDDYSFLKAAYFDSTGYNYKSEAGIPNQYNTIINNHPTGGKVKVIRSGMAKWLRSVSYYDNQYRVIQTIRENHIGGRDRISIVYEFNGKTKTNLHTHIGPNPTPIVIQNNYIYDGSGRLLSRQHKIGNNTPVNLIQNNFNELGGLIEKNFHGTSTGFLQSVDYRYNIRGWITSINNSLLSTDGGVTNNDATDIFGMELKYESGLVIDPSKAQFNGNIAEVIWKNKLDSKLKAYSFSYDTLNRLKYAQYKVLINNSWNNAESGRFNEEIPFYDLNGNILALNRAGVIGYNSSTAKHSYGQSDSLKYFYKGNQLLSIKDTVPDIVMPNGFKSGDFSDGITDTYIFDINNTATHDYAYDENGSLIKDKNKGIDSISYNVLNYTQRVKMKDGKLLVFTYDATGTKLSKKVYDSQGKGLDSTDYIGLFEYKGNVLRHISTGEGRLVPNGSNFNYEYFIKDHQDNVRAVVSSKTPTVPTDGLIVSYSDYYPFGLMHGGISNVATIENNYLYNGKELQRDFDLNIYDYGARMYDPVIAKWAGVDPLGDKMPMISPYAYCFNNPVKYVDKNGECPILPFIIKAGINGATDLLMQVVMNYYFDDKSTDLESAFKNVNWWQVGRSGIEGALPWKAPGGKLTKAAATAALDVVTNALHNGSNYSTEQAVLDFATGFLGQLAGGGISELIEKYGASGVAKGLTQIFDLKEAIDYVWKYVDPKLRGEVFEHMLANTKFKGFRHIGIEKNGWFPYIDFYKDGKGISLKTTTAEKGYNDILGNIKNLAAAREKGKVGGVELNEVELHIGVPEGFNMDNLNKVIKEALKYDVNVKIFFIN